MVAINAFPSDFDSEHEAISEIAREAGARVAVHRGVAEGGAGATDLADAVAEACDDASELVYTYDDEDSLETKISKVATGVYGADGIEVTPAARKQLALYEELGYGKLPVVIAKTHLSISSDPALKGGTHRLDAARSRGAPGSWCWLRLRYLRHDAHHARPAQASGGRAHRL